MVITCLPTTSLTSSPTLSPPPSYTGFKLHFPPCCSLHRPSTLLFQLWFLLPRKHFFQLSKWLTLFSFRSYIFVIKVALLNYPPWRILNLGTTDILSQIILSWGGGCSLHCGMFSSIPGLKVLDATVPHCPVVIMDSVSIQVSPGRQNWHTPK